MGKPPLRATTAEDAAAAEAAATAAATVPATLAEAVGCSERALLVAVRRKLAAELDAGVPPAYLAPISRQLREVDKEIRALDAAAKKEQGEDDISFTPDEPLDASAF